MLFKYFDKISVTKKNRYLQIRFHTPMWILASFFMFPYSKLVGIQEKANVTLSPSIGLLGVFRNFELSRGFSLNPLHCGNQSCAYPHSGMKQKVNIIHSNLYNII